MNRAAAETLAAVDAIVLVVEALRFGPEDKRVLAQLPADAKVVLAINKVDRVERRERCCRSSDSARRLIDSRRSCR